jgi:5-methyltetrahydropteroyltriglutamate--homocysteine methyltransferase
VIATTLVGSFPLEFSEPNIRRALEDQAKLGITYPVLPQLRDFVYIFLEPLVKQGVVSYEKRGYVLRRHLEEAEPIVPPDYIIARDIARELGLRFRVPVTGPFTLASKIALSLERVGDISGSALTDKDMLEKVVSYVSGLASKLDKEVRGDVYCVDEPVLAVIVGARNVMYNLTLEYLQQALESVLSRLGGVHRGVHVCGRLPPLLKKVLLGLHNADFLDHEHSDFPSNRVYYTRDELAKNSKRLAFGVISPVKPSVEDYSSVLQLAREARETYGEMLLFLKPDCGFGGLRGVLNGREYEEIVLEKMRVLVKVALEA